MGRLGMPKQEKWIVEHLGKIDATALIGVGAALTSMPARSRVRALDAALGAGIGVPADDRAAPARSPLPDRQRVVCWPYAAAGHGDKAYTEDW